MRLYSPGSALSTSSVRITGTVPPFDGQPQVVGDDYLRHHLPPSPGRASLVGGSRRIAAASAPADAGAGHAGCCLRRDAVFVSRRLGAQGLVEDQPVASGRALD